MKKILAFLLIFCVIFSSLSMGAFAEATQTDTSVVSTEANSFNEFFTDLGNRISDGWYKFTSFFNHIFYLFKLGEETQSIEITKSTEVKVAQSDSNLYKSAIYAYNVKNGVQAIYSDTNRNAMTFKNQGMILEQNLTDSVKTATISTIDGKEYIKDSFYTFYTDKNDVRRYFEKSGIDARVNNIRLGQYYYDCHVRDLAANGLKVDKNYHVYSDKLYQQYYLYSSAPTTSVKNFGFEVSIPKKNVSSIEIKDKLGVHSSVQNIDEQNVEYVAFDIKNVGVIGFIIPSDNSTQKVEIKETSKNYIVTQYANYTPFDGINKSDETGGYELNYVTFGSRIYNDSTHSFDGISKAAYEERNPLTDITVSANNVNGKYLEYDALRGAYTFTQNGLDFNYAYNRPDLQCKLPISIKGDDIDRKIYIRSFGNCGCLEAAALLDSEDVLAPIDVEVCKNFQGDGGEPFYGIIDYQYGDSFFPVSIEKNQKSSFTLLNLYQNWGQYPLKQISSIEFHVSYYHISTGTTESNCIAPYFVNSKDGWTLPDFRNRSGEMWSTQPQFNSVGILKFMAQKNTLSEFCGSKVDSTGQTYCDVTDYYTSDDGAFDYSTRHVEFPQTDENRTYYDVHVTFNKNVTYKNFKKNFDLFYFNGRFVQFNKLGYLNDKNECTVANVDSSDKDVYYTLGSNCPYYGFFDVTDETDFEIDKCFGCNFALIIRDSKIVINGKETDIAFAVRDESNKNETIGCLTLDAKKLSFKKGDTIDLQIILLPWGVGREDNDSNVRAVREDSALNPITVTAKVGTIVNDVLVPTIKADNNVAEFTLKGGRNNNAVRIDGITIGTAPMVYKFVNDKWENVKISSTNGYDGYSIHINDDGTYSVSFVYEAKTPYEENTFRVQYDS